VLEVSTPGYPEPVKLTSEEEEDEPDAITTTMTIATTTAPATSHAQVGILRSPAIGATLCDHYSEVKQWASAE